jgi:predicted nucleic acid-binding protein
LNSQSTFAEILLRSDHEFFVCEMTLVEIFKHKDKITKASRLSDDDLARLYHILLRRITLHKEDLISTENRRTAYHLCFDIDESDTPHVALALELDAFLWTGDKKLREGLKKKDFNRLFESGK